MDRENNFENTKSPRERAVSYIFSTMGVEDSHVEAFPSVLFSQIEQLERYKEAYESVKDLPKADIPLEIFQRIQRSADSPKVKEMKGNGVLINSMKQGAFECAGRSMIVSRLLTHFDIGHFIANPYGHSLVLVKVNEDTYAYCDPNQGVYFTFPVEALTVNNKNKTSQKVKEYTLSGYMHRKGDIYAGLFPIVNTILVFPDQEGIINSYLNNVKAALAGNKEFQYDDIHQDLEASAEVEKIKKGLLGEYYVDDSVYEIQKEEHQKQVKEAERLQQIIREIFTKTENEAEFVNSIADHEVWQLFPYIPTGDRGNVSRQIYQRMLYREMNEQV